MGTYWKLVNVTKQEQYEPANIKASGFRAYADKIVELLLERWMGDEVRLVNDEFGSAEARNLYERADGWPNVWVSVATPMAPPKQRTVAEFLALKDLRSMLIGPDWYTMECPKGCPPGRCNATDDPCSLMERQREKQTGRD